MGFGIQSTFLKNLEVMLHVNVLINTYQYCLMKVAKQLHCCCCYLPDEGCQTTALLLLFVCLFVLPDKGCQTTALLLSFVCLFVLPDEGCQTTAIEMLQINLVKCCSRRLRFTLRKFLTTRTVWADSIVKMEPDSWEMAHSETDLS